MTRLWMLSATELAARIRAGEISAVEAVRARDVKSLNADILYGLPNQTRQRVSDSVQKLLSLSPDRVALYGYAHVPWMARRQQMIPSDTLPRPEERLALFETAQRLFEWDGYVDIGIDHFARAGDGLAIAARNGTLRRNFQGYTDDKSEVLVGLGTSSISRFPQGYAQMNAATSGWGKSVQAGAFATVRGHAFAGEDRLRARIIEALMCDFAVKTDELVRDFGIRGFKFHPTFQGFYPNDRMAYALYEAIEAEGAILVPIDATCNPDLPDIDGLFIGGGFPEMRMRELAANTGLRGAILAALRAGLPAYAECGGLMYLCETLEWQGEVAPMVGLIPATARMHERAKGRGYVAFESTDACPWQVRRHVPVKAHEFHYASVEGLPADTVFARHMRRGTGTDGTHDGIVIANTVAGFCHLRNTVAVPWVPAFLDFVDKVKSGRK